MNVAHLAQIDLDTGGPTRLQVYISVAILVGLAALAVLRYVQQQFAGLEEHHAQHKARIREALSQQEPETLHLQREALLDDADAVRGRVRDALLADREEVTETGVSEAVAVAGGLVLKGLEARIGPVPKLARRLGGEAIVAAVFGFIAFSTSVLVAALQQGPSGGPLALLGEVLSLPGVSLAVALVGALVVLFYAHFVTAWVSTTIALLVATGAALLAARVGDSDGTDASRGSAVWVLQGVAKTLGVALLPVTVVYVGLSLTRLPTLVGAFVTASLTTQVLVVLLLGGLALGLWLVLSRTVPELGQRLAVAAARQQVRLVAVRSLAPVIVVMLGYVWGVGILSWWQAAIVAVVFGLIARAVTGAVIRASRRQRLRDRDREKASVDVAVYRVPDASGETHYLCRVDRTWLGWPTDGPAGGYDTTVDRMASAVVSVGKRVVTDADESPLVEEQYASALRDRGWTDTEEVWDLLSERVRETLETGDRYASMEALREELSEFPREVREPMLDRWLKLGLVRRRGEFWEVRL